MLETVSAGLNYLCFFVLGLKCSSSIGTHANPVRHLTKFSRDTLAMICSSPLPVWMVTLIRSSLLIPPIGREIVNDGFTLPPSRSACLVYHKPQPWRGGWRVRLGWGRGAIGLMTFLLLPHTMGRASALVDSGPEAGRTMAVGWWS